MAILCCICVWHAVVPLLNDGDACCSRRSQDADHIALAVLAAVYVGFHLLFVFVIAFVVSRLEKIFHVFCRSCSRPSSLLPYSEHFLKLFFKSKPDNYQSTKVDPIFKSNVHSKYVHHFCLCGVPSLIISILSRKYICRLIY